MKKDAVQNQPVTQAPTQRIPIPQDHRKATSALKTPAQRANGEKTPGARAQQASEQPTVPVLASVTAQKDHSQSASVASIAQGVSTSTSTVAQPKKDASASLLLPASMSAVSRSFVETGNTSKLPSLTQPNRTPGEDGNSDDKSSAARDGGESASRVSVSNKNRSPRGPPGISRVRLCDHLAQMSKFATASEASELSGDDAEGSAELERRDSQDSDAEECGRELLSMMMSGAVHGSEQSEDNVVASSDPEDIDSSLSDRDWQGGYLAPIASTLVESLPQTSSMGDVGYNAEDGKEEAKAASAGEEGEDAASVDLERHMMEIKAMVARDLDSDSPPPTTGSSSETEFSETSSLRPATLDSTVLPSLDSFSPDVVLTDRDIEIMESATCQEANSRGDEETLPQNEFLPPASYHMEQLSATNGAGGAEGSAGNGGGVPGTCRIGSTFVAGGSAHGDACAGKSVNGAASPKPSTRVSQVPSKEESAGSPHRPDSLVPNMPWSSTIAWLEDSAARSSCDAKATAADASDRPESLTPQVPWAMPAKIPPVIWKARLNEAGPGKSGTPVQRGEAQLIPRVPWSKPPRISRGGNSTEDSPRVDWASSQSIDSLSVKSSTATPAPVKPSCTGDSTNIPMVRGVSSADENIDSKGSACSSHAADEMLSASQRTLRGPAMVTDDRVAFQVTSPDDEDSSIAKGVDSAKSFTEKSLRGDGRDRSGVNRSSQANPACSSRVNGWSEGKEAERVQDAIAAGKGRSRDAKASSEFIKISSESRSRDRQVESKRMEFSREASTASSSGASSMTSVASSGATRPAESKDGERVNETATGGAPRQQTKGGEGGDAKRGTNSGGAKVPESAQTTGSRSRRGTSPTPTGGGPAREGRERESRRYSSGEGDGRSRHRDDWSTSGSSSDSSSYYRSRRRSRSNDRYHYHGYGRRGRDWDDSDREDRFGRSRRDFRYGRSDWSYEYETLDYQSLAYRGRSDSR